MTRGRRKILEIEFPKGFKKPIRFANHLATGVGIVIRHSPELDCISNWSDIPECQKMPVYAGLEQWFNIKGWWSDQVVTTYMEEIFQTSYTHWRGRLSSSYKHMVLVGENPRASSPFEWIPIQKWRALCDYYETEKFKKRSKINAENRSHLPYTHTSGSQSFHTRLSRMENQSVVDNFAHTHTQNGLFINEKAAAMHAEMVKKMNQSKQSDGDEVSER